MERNPAPGRVLEPGRPFHQDRGRDASTGKLPGSRILFSNHGYKSGGTMEAHFGLGSVSSVQLSLFLLGDEEVVFEDIAADRFPKIDPRAKTAVAIKAAGAGRKGQLISPSLFTSNRPWAAARGRIREEWWAIEDLNF